MKVLFENKGLDFDELRRALWSAAYLRARDITAELEKATHGKITEIYACDIESESAREKYWAEVTKAYQRAIMKEVSEEIERFAAELIICKAAEWEQAAKGDNNTKLS